MSNIIAYNEVEEKVITIREQTVLLDSSVAELYGVEVREINQAVRNNPDKFPEGYILSLTTEEWTSLRSNILTLNEPKGSTRNICQKPSLKKDCICSRLS